MVADIPTQIYSLEAINWFMGRYCESYLAYPIPILQPKEYPYSPRLKYPTTALFLQTVSNPHTGT